MGARMMITRAEDGSAPLRNRAENYGDEIRFGHGWGNEERCEMAESLIGCGDLFDFWRGLIELRN